MKLLLAGAALATAISLTATAAEEHHGHGTMAPSTRMQGAMGAQNAQSSPAAKWVDGEVRKVDPRAGKLTLAHGPLTHLGMDMAMTMAFRVKDAAWLDRLKPGDKVRFVAEDIDGVLTVVQLETAR